jgi:hypothetical protein
MSLSRGLHLIVLALASFAPPEPSQRTFRITENSSERIAGNVRPTVHTALAFNPTAQEAARQNAA